jgi:signal transduction histidine kinase
MEDFLNYCLHDCIKKEDHNVNANLLKGNESAMPTIEDFLNTRKEAEASDFFNPAFHIRFNHKIRTSMNAIMGFAQILSHDEISIEERKLCAETICKETEDLLLGFNQILDILITKTVIYRSCG